VIRTRWAINEAVDIIETEDRDMGPGRVAVGVEDSPKDLVDPLLRGLDTGLGKGRSGHEEVTKGHIADFSHLSEGWDVVRGGTEPVLFCCAWSRMHDSAKSAARPQSSFPYPNSFGSSVCTFSDEAFQKASAHSGVGTHPILLIAFAVRARSWASKNLSFFGERRRNCIRKKASSEGERKDRLNQCRCIQ